LPEGLVWGEHYVNRRAALVVAVTLLAPALCYPKDVAIPAVGIELTGAPEITGAPVVHRESDGAEAIVRLGEALIVVYRGDTAVPNGTVATEEASESRLKTAPDLIYWPQTPGRPTILAGQPAWASYYTYEHRQLTDYVLVVSTVIDAHWYILQVIAQSRSDKPADFDRAVETLQDARFGQMGAVSELVPEPAQATPPGLPRGRLDSKQEFYPPDALRREEQGDVDLEFRIDGHGQVRDIRKTYAATRDLAASAQEMIQRTGFDVPNDWEQRGADKQVFTVEVQYNVRCHGPGLRYPPRVVEAEVIYICAGFPPRQSRKN
jgi:TonB family protein